MGGGEGEFVAGEGGGSRHCCEGTGEGEVEDVGFLHVIDKGFLAVPLC